MSRPPAEAPPSTGRSWPGLSIRARLTVAIAVLTAAVAGLAVVTGMRAMEQRIRDRTIDAQIGLFDELTSEEVLAPFDVLLDEELAPLDGLDELDELDDAGLVLDEPEVSAIDEALVSTMSELRRLELADLLFDEFGDDGTLTVLLFDGDAATVEQSTGEIEFADLEVLLAEEPERIIVPQFDLEELVFASLEQFGGTGDSPDREVDGVVTDVDGLRFGRVVDFTDELSALDGIEGLLWVAAGGLVILATGTTWLLTGWALRPVAAITDRVDLITSGTLDGRVPESGSDDEIGVLARTMNRMLGRLERADLQRRQFVSDASHELRTPLAVLRSEAEVADRAPGTTTVADLARVVLGEATRLESLVEDLLALARSDERELAGGPTVTPVELDIDDIVLAEAERTRRLPVDCSQVSGGRVEGRSDDLARAVGHLLDNAARHGESTVAVGVRTDGDRVRIWVEDDGAGLAEEDRERIFDRFTRLDEARTRDRGGSGLGLAVVAETAVAHRGTVAVDRGRLGGARFTIDLPAAAPVG